MGYRNLFSCLHGREVKKDGQRCRIRGRMEKKCYFSELNTEKLYNHKIFVTPTILRNQKTYNLQHELQIKRERKPYVFSKQRQVLIKSYPENSVVAQASLWKSVFLAMFSYNEKDNCLYTGNIELFHFEGRMSLQFIKI